MVASSRAVVTVGLVLAGLATCAGTSPAQQTKDNAVRRTASQGTAAAKPAPPVAPVFGTVDIKAVFNGYDKVKMQKEEFKAAAMVKYNEMQKLQTEGQEEAQKLAKMTPNSVDAKNIENRLTQIKAQMEAGREQAQRDFALRESEMLASWYAEVQVMVARLAQHRGMTYVVQVSNEPVSGSNPDSVLAAMAKTVVYADPRNDITNDVVYHLNRQYKAAGGAVPKAAATANPVGN